jgi:hypothetical protein
MEGAENEQHEEARICRHFKKRAPPDAVAETAKHQSAAWCAFALTRCFMIIRSMSGNGMVRPCSWPASDKLARGAQTRSTLCPQRQHRMRSP